MVIRAEGHLESLQVVPAVTFTGRRPGPVSAPEHNWRDCRAGTSDCPRRCPGMVTPAGCGHGTDDLAVFRLCAKKKRDKPGDLSRCWGDSLRRTTGLIPIGTARWGERAARVSNRWGYGPVGAASVCSSRSDSAWGSTQWTSCCCARPAVAERASHESAHERSRNGVSETGENERFAARRRYIAGPLLSGRTVYCVVSGSQAVSRRDPQLCVPASRQVCLYRRATQRAATPERG